jgi:hypothetical protein
VRPRWLLDKRSEKERGGGTQLRDDEDDRFRRIRCPKCTYQPTKHDRWSCDCHHVWNTFDTRGVCPACFHVWKQTACPRCHAWSPHDSWYANEP